MSDVQRLSLTRATEIKSLFGGGGEGRGSVRGLSLKIAILTSLNCRIVTGPDVN